MFSPTILLLFLVTSPALVCSIECYSCKLIIVNYLVTNVTVPPFSDCQVVNASQCSIAISWDLNDNLTAIEVYTSRPLLTQNALEDSVTPMTFMSSIPAIKNPLLSHGVLFVCASSDRCNGEMSLKQILRSIVIEDQFRQELSPLIKVVTPFDPKTAGCIDFRNVTGRCEPTDLDNCKRCRTIIDKLSSFNEEICAACPKFYNDINLIRRSTTFILNNRTQLSDQIELDCQVKGCNSIDNANQIYKASKIVFNFDEFFKNSLNKHL